MAWRTLPGRCDADAEERGHRAGQRLVTEKLTAVRHANGRDYWVLVHGWAKLRVSQLPADGGRAGGRQPVASAVGVVHQTTAPAGAGVFDVHANASGYQCGPRRDGRLLAVAARQLPAERCLPSTA